ncbi:hypothetical protein FZEAL_10895 [Fusarium zealandicum]|uniref:Uncharacterized protein n=1 Tax=Fusarium zealandicum TaxID=1053134 RepID=A0A8H4TU52_9HYPO|nr:hypothetical protein FZEAL_10895 [Fusarium zealandicum]
MALEQTITIVNNSGKIVQSGKQLFSIFKEAQGTYKEKKAQLKSEQALQRSQTYDGRQPPREQPRCLDDNARYYPPRASDARSDTRSRASRRSRSVTSQSRHPQEDYDTRSRPALTANNLKTHSEVSSVTPSRAPSRTYVDPYGENITMDLAIPAHRGVARTEMRSMAPSAYSAAYGPGPGTVVPRNRSTGELVPAYKPRKEIDMDLAYGNVPPDLAERTDLDPQTDERHATDLVQRVEGLLTEAHCIHHSATHTMAELQKNPDKAAAVALSLADLSNLVKKTSPAFLTLLKSGSPAVFSLLASPHFLIGTSIAVGVTVVCFGGWKIVKRVKEAQAAREALAYEGVPMDRPAPMRTQSEYSGGGMEEALIIDDDLSSIETWMRGIEPYGETADMELITPRADRDTRDRYGDDFDVQSRRSTRTSKTSKTSKTHDSQRSHRSHRSEVSQRSHRSRKDADRDDDRSSRRGTESVADSERSRRSSKRSEKVETRSIDSRSRGADELVMRPKSNRNNSNMLKALFKGKEKKERELVMA